MFLKISQNTQENTCVGVSILLKLQTLSCKFFKKEALVQVFSCKLSKIFKKAFFTEHLRATASVLDDIAIVLIMRYRW